MGGGEEQMVEMWLYYKWDENIPYHDLRLWVNVVGNK